MFTIFFVGSTWKATIIVRQTKKGKVRDNNSGSYWDVVTI